MEIRQVALPGRVPIHVRTAGGREARYPSPRRAAVPGRLVKVCIPASRLDDAYNGLVTLTEYLRQIPSRGASAVWVFGVHFPTG